VVLDKENAYARGAIFMIDASRGFMKAGNKNRLRNQDYGRIHAWDRGTTLLAHGQLRGDVDSGKNGILKGNVQNRMMEVREVALEMVPSETDERVPPIALRETSL
jgi:hypothetical protein